MTINSDENYSSNPKLSMMRNESPRQVHKDSTIHLNNDEKAKLHANSILKSDYDEPDFESSVSSVQNLNKALSRDKLKPEPKLIYLIPSQNE